MIISGYAVYLLLLLSRDGVMSLDLRQPNAVFSPLITVKQSPTLIITRRDAWISTIALVTTTISATNIEPENVARALEYENAAIGTVFVKGTVNLAADLDNPPRLQVENGTSTSTPALYITCRPDRPDNVPQAILAGTRGKPPPVLAARFENPSSFPFSFVLGEDDLTMEGAVKDETTGLYWWLNSNNKDINNLVVSARWDSDGVAATRSPEDLVGRAVAVKKQQQQQQRDDESSSSSSMYTVTIDLGGRGAFGKFATGTGSGTKK